ncbi:MAG TPA: dockerin type I repeat-containing protein [Tepidisphaeraceae bacterium]|jgi:hypothetical protein|nr:dockerin type I repeat-containing protein [Tepidisphaeraceae bacterium]
MSSCAKSHALLITALLAVSIPATSSLATVFLQDDFESYTSTADMQAVWGSSGAGSLDNSLAGANNNSMFHPGGTVNTENFNPGNFVPTDNNPIVWQFDFYWDGSDNKRMTGGLRDNASGADPNALLEMGYYNDALNPINNDDSDEGFAYRTALLPNSTNWVLFTSLDNSTKLAPTGGTWSTFRAIIKKDSVTFTVDLGRDGTIDSTATVGVDSTDITYNIARFGGPSSLSSAGGGADFDNISIQSILLGDANGDGKIGPDDYALLDRGFAKQLTGFANGDFNFDNVIDANDYLIIDATYAAQIGGLSPAFLAQRSAQFGDAYVSTLLASLPEPSAMFFAGLSAVMAVKRRRRR